MVNDDVVGLVEFRQGVDDLLATLTVTVQRPNGDIDLVAVIQQAAAAEDTEFIEHLRKQWPLLQDVFRHSTHALNLKTTLSRLPQQEISDLASEHLRKHKLDVPGDQGVLPKTARMWRLLQQFGSHQPAAIIAALLQEKIPTIHARINLARAQGLIPPTNRRKEIADADIPALRRLSNNRQGA
jgi:hypothetical protein